MRTAAILLLLAGDAAADCATRPASAAEKAAHKAAMSAFRKAAPPPPAGWTLSEEIGAEPLRVCKGLDHIPLKFNLLLRYARAHDAQAREDKAVGKIAAASKRQTQRQEDDSARLAAIERELEEVGAKMQKAGASGDMKQIEALGQRMEKLSEEKARLSVEPGFGEETAAAVSEQETDATAEVEFAANEDGSLYVSGYKPLKSAGAEHAYRGALEDRAVSLEEAVFAAGPWKLEEGALVPPDLEGKAHAKIHTVSMRVRAEPARLSSLLKAANVPALRAALK